MVFVMGKERSGTTLLQTFLGGNPNIVAPPEYDFIVLLYPRFGKIKKWREKDILDFIEQLYAEQWISKVWHLDRDLLTSILLSIKDQADYPCICKVVYYCMRGTKENILWISDKNPMYVLFIKTILKIFPDAKFIHLIRDPRDNVNSHLQAFSVTNVKFITMKWLSYNTILLKSRNKYPEKCYAVLYEDLVQDPEACMKGICGFLKISFTDKMIQNTFPSRLENLGNQKELLGSAKAIHANLLKPVNTSNIGKWKTGMPPEDIGIVEKITGDFASKNFNYIMSEGYNKTSTRINIQILKAKIIYYSWQFFTRMKFKSYRFNIFYTRTNLRIGRQTRVFERILKGI